MVACAVHCTCSNDTLDPHSFPTKYKRSHRCVCHFLAHSPACSAACRQPPPSAVTLSSQYPLMHFRMHSRVALLAGMLMFDGLLQRLYLYA